MLVLFYTFHITKLLGITRTVLATSISSEHFNFLSTLSFGFFFNLKICKAFIFNIFFFEKYIL
jgi:hypothetical protein